jgi:hypothetical protein
MRLRTILSVLPVCSLIACGGSNDSAETAAPQDLSASSGHASDMHDVFVCQTDDKIDSVTMFAFDEHGEVDVNKTGPGFCQIDLDGSGKPIDSYMCFVFNSATATTTDGQLALVFSQSLGDTSLFHQYNLPKDLREKKGGKGTMRILSRNPQDLTKPIPASDAEHADCKLQSVKFPPKP